jgi:glycerol-3-phosphate acyltransferase PlsY
VVPGCLPVRGADGAAAVARLAAAFALGYVAGAFPSADLASHVATRAQYRDLRAEGSGNPGALNAARVLGWRWGAGVLATDMAKGAVAAQVGRGIGGGVGAYTAATAAIAGHVAPPRRGRGGKGVATSAGACVAVFPAYFPIDAGVAALSAVSSSRASTATRISCAAWVAASVLWWRRQLPNAWGPRPTVALPMFAAASSLMILWRVGWREAPR